MVGVVVNGQGRAGRTVAARTINGRTKDVVPEPKPKPGPYGAV